MVICKGVSTSPEKLARGLSITSSYLSCEIIPLKAWSRKPHAMISVVYSMCSWPIGALAMFAWKYVVEKSSSSHLGNIFDRLGQSENKTV
jgi:hypothetical protein